MAKNNISNFDISAHIITCDASHRGGSIKVDVSSLFNGIEDGEEAIMGAYQNYLGGGMRGAIVGASMFNPDALDKVERAMFDALKEKIKKYFYQITNDEELDMNDEWNTMAYEKQQSLPVSAY